MNIVVFLTFGVSIKDWKESGLLQREILLYQQISSTSNINFTFITFGDSEDEKYLNGHKIIPYYKYNKYYKNKYITVLQSLLFTFKLKKLIAQPDLIKTNQLLGSWMAILYKVITKKPLIVRTGYDLYRFSLHENKTRLKKSLYYILTQLAIIFSDAYLVTSYSDKKFLDLNFFKTKNKLQILPNWVEGKITNTVTKIEKRHENKLLAVGRLEEQKNFSTLIRLLSSKDFHIDIVGTGSLKNSLALEAKEYGVQVNFLGKKNYNELIRMYPNYRLYVSTSLFEGNPKSTLEAMGAGCVAIVSNIENNSEIIENKITGFLHNFDNLVELIEQNINNIDALDRLSKKATEKIRNNNSLDIISKKEIEIYNFYHLSLDLK
jgi:glycosyltransferase involved in cell wall biosynthesis